MSERIIPTPQVIEEDGHPAYAVLTWPEWQALVAALEDRSDAEALAAFEAKLAAGREELIPAEVAEPLLLGEETPLKVVRRWRGLTQARLAAATGLNQGYLSEIEAGKKSPSVDALKRLARALDVDLDLLVPVN